VIKEAKGIVKSATVSPNLESGMFVGVVPGLVGWRGARRHSALAGSTCGSRSHFQLAHDHKQATDLVDTTQVRLQLIPVLLPRRLVLLLRNIAGHEAALQSKQVLRSISNLIPEIPDPPGKILAQLRHLISHSPISLGVFLLQHSKPLAEAVDLSYYLVYRYLTHLVAPKSRLTDGAAAITAVVTRNTQKE